MGPDLTATTRVMACPSCGAGLRPDALWCGQCHADLRPKAVVVPPPPLAAPARAAYGVAAADPLTAPLLDFLPPVPTEAARSGAAPAVDAPPATAAQPCWPCVRCAASNPLSESVCAGCGGRFLAEVTQAGKPLLVLPVVGDLGAMSRGRRAGLAVGLVAAVVAPLALLTLVLTQPPESAPGLGSVTTVTSTPP